MKGVVAVIYKDSQLFVYEEIARQLGLKQGDTMKPCSGR